MAINKVNTTTEEENFNFLTNQSSILYTAEKEDTIVNGVNIIVDKPKKGDVMCITRYEKGGVLLGADKQKVVWIDGLSINLKQLYKNYEAVGICLNVKGNKALVRYKTDKSNLRWSAVDRWELPNSSIMNDLGERTLQITLDGKVNANPLVLTTADTISRKAFVNKLNSWFLANDTNYSAELVELDTDLPAVDTTDVKDGDSYRNRIVVNARFTDFKNKTINIEEIGSGTRVIGKHIKDIDWFYRNNGFKDSKMYSGCCRAAYYDYWSKNGTTVLYSPLESINSINSTYNHPVALDFFTSHKYGKILRDNFSSYDEYIESLLVKCPCGAGGVITEFPSGKENTYKLANCTFLNNVTGEQAPLYLAANYAASIDLNAPKLGKGNWWLPSAAEVIEIMRDITYRTSFWDTNPDIVNQVLIKLNSIDSSWSILYATEALWSSSMYNRERVWGCYSDGSFTRPATYLNYTAYPITIYEF